MKRNRVFVTGVGVVSPLGLDSTSSWRALCEGASGARRIRGFDASGWPVDYACEVKDFDPDFIAREDLERLNLPARFAAAATREAFAMSGLRKAPDPARAGLIYGTGIGTIKPAELVETFSAYELRPGLPAIMQYLEKRDKPLGMVQVKNHPAYLSAYLAEKYELGGYNASASSACASGAQAIGYGYSAIARGKTDLMLVGGTDSLAGELLFAGFCLLGVMSAGAADPSRAARPFDKNRSGFIAGEGAASLVIESEASVLERGATPLAEIIGYGESENAYRITDLPEDGAGAVFSMRQACEAHLPTTDCINAHGTATRQNDKIESAAIERVFYDQGLEPVITANKAQIGHFIAAAGAVEAVFSILSLRDQKLPPIVNLETSDCSPRLKFAGPKVKDLRIRSVLSNSFGFGGTNSSVLFREVL